MEEEQIKKIYDELNALQKANYLKKFNNNKKKLIWVFGSLLSLIIFTLISILSSLNDNSIELMAFVCVLFFIYIVIFLTLLIINILKLKWSDEKKIRMQITLAEKKKNAEIQLLNKRIAIERAKGIYAPDIKSVILLDAYTEVSDKLHAILNYQEIIQTRFYKFKVTYINGTSKIITTKEDSAEYNTLIKLVNKENYISAEPDKVDMLKKYKQLLDDGVITQEEFEKKKKELL